MELEKAPPSFPLSISFDSIQSFSLFLTFVFLYVARTVPATIEGPGPDEHPEGGDAGN